MDGVFQGLAGLLRGISEGEARGKSRGAALPARGKTPFILTLLIGFMFYLKYDILVIFLNLLIICLGKSLTVAKLLEYVHHIIGVSLMFLCH